MFVYQGSECFTAYYSYKLPSIHDLLNIRVSKNRYFLARYLPLFISVLEEVSCVKEATCVTII